MGGDGRRWEETGGDGRRWEEMGGDDMGGCGPRPGVRLPMSHESSAKTTVEAEVRVRPTPAALIESKATCGSAPRDVATADERRSGRATRDGPRAGVGEVCRVGRQSVRGAQPVCAVCAFRCVRCAGCAN
jgi:hypothetical protein